MSRKREKEGERNVVSVLPATEARSDVGKSVRCPI